MVHLGSDLSLIKYLAEMVCWMTGKNEAVISQDLSLFLDLREVSLEYILVLLLILWDSEYLGSIFGTPKWLYFHNT